MGITLIAFLMNVGFSLEVAPELQDTFTVTYEPRSQLLHESIDSSHYELNLLLPSTKNMLLRSLVLIDNRPAMIEPLRLSKTNLLLSKHEILNDLELRVNDQFHIPENLYDRVSFWFDIYTKHDSNTIVFHDMDNPWIIYRVVDITPILEQPNKHKWTKYHESQRFLKNTRAEIVKSLLKLSKSKSYKNLNAEEAAIYQMYSTFKNPRTKIRGAVARLRSQTGQKDHFQQGLTRAAPYLPKMEEIFAKNKLPIELTRIPLVESSFNTEAYSKVGASGIWQIMPYIGKQFGMFKGNKDLRSDVFSSTAVAAKLLKEKHMILKEWPLSITAYNHGPGGLRKAVKTVRSSDLGKIVEQYENKRFGFASQNFYACFLASLYAERYQEMIFKADSQEVLVGSAPVDTSTSKN
jgi:membrane-bound lytic murein transglycosylase D